MGQKTGTSKILNNDMTIDMDTALTADNLKRERERERERGKGSRVSECRRRREFYLLLFYLNKR